MNRILVGLFTLVIPTPLSFHTCVVRSPLSNATIIPISGFFLFSVSYVSFTLKWCAALITPPLAFQFLFNFSALVSDPYVMTWNRHWLKNFRFEHSGSKLVCFPQALMDFLVSVDLSTRICVFCRELPRARLFVWIDRDWWLVTCGCGPFAAVSLKSTMASAKRRLLRYLIPISIQSIKLHEKTSSKHSVSSLGD